MSLHARVDVPGRLDAEFEVPSGAVLAVVGPNGAGKTTLLRSLAGLLDAGSDIVVDGESWSEPFRRPRERRVGYVVQGQALFPHLSARENAAFGLRARGVRAAAARERADAELKRLGVGHLADRRPGQLSGGQAQRVALARALATDPTLLLLDEPFSGLDVTVAAAARIELREHLAEFAGVSVLVTHDAVDALTLGSHMVVLEGGRLVQKGSPHEVAERPRSQHVARLVGLNVRADEDSYVAFRPSDITLSLSEPEGSARLRWQGEVAHLTPLADIVRVTLRAGDDDAAAPLVADVTATAAAELGLRPGLAMWASCKQTSLTRYPIRPEVDRPAPLPSGHGD